ncbi:hypothetical protein [Cupriavidus necator]|uniref:hypothetical protein n=1 Tax=Cupriavidus necator TaxID=106590 RepID=UPI00278694A0|nr:hypothetical protein [Cupriavidus necator]MDQ0140970.1 flagellar motility protein MotE (MotC chaperone) [Cupriavidus necator]
MTDETQDKTATRSDSTRALIRERALERGQQRSAEVERRVREAMQTIEAEIDANDGIYPHNKGALSSAELARRADVHPTTFFSPKQRALGDEVKQWLEGIKARKVVGRGPVRRELATRIADWSRLFEGLAQSHRDTELELQQTQAELAQTREDLAKLQHENDHLKKLLSAAGNKKVVPLRPKKS